MSCHFCSRNGSVRDVEIKGPRGTVMIFHGEICDEDVRRMSERDVK